MTKKALPARWTAYTPIGRRIPGTRLIAHKTPLQPSVFMNRNDSHAFTLDHLFSAVPDIGLVIDLTQTTRYYDFTDVLDRGVSYLKIMVAGQVIPLESEVKKFFSAIDWYLENHQDGSLISVHCTHGVNRTGYLLARYLIQRLGFGVEESISRVARARGHPIERSQYLEELSRHREILPRCPSSKGIMHRKPVAVTQQLQGIPPEVDMQQGGSWKYTSAVTKRTARGDDRFAKKRSPERRGGPNGGSKSLDSRSFPMELSEKRSPRGRFSDHGGYTRGAFPPGTEPRSRPERRNSPQSQMSAPTPVPPPAPRPLMEVTPPAPTGIGPYTRPLNDFAMNEWRQGHNRRPESPEVMRRRRTPSLDKEELRFLRLQEEKILAEQDLDFRHLERERGLREAPDVRPRESHRFRDHSPPRLIDHQEFDRARKEGHRSSPPPVHNVFRMKSMSREPDNYRPPLSRGSDKLMDPSRRFREGPDLEERFLLEKDPTLVEPTRYSRHDRWMNEREMERVRGRDRRSMERMPYADHMQKEEPYYPDMAGPSRAFTPPPRESIRPSFRNQSPLIDYHRSPSPHMVDRRDMGPSARDLWLREEERRRVGNINQRPSLSPPIRHSSPRRLSPAPLSPLRRLSSPIRLSPPRRSSPLRNSPIRRLRSRSPLRREEAFRNRDRDVDRRPDRHTEIDRRHDRRIEPERKLDRRPDLDRRDRRAEPDRRDRRAEPDRRDRRAEPDRRPDPDSDRRPDRRADLERRPDRRAVPDRRQERRAVPERGLDRRLEDRRSSPQVSPVRRRSPRRDSFPINVSESPTRILVEETRWHTRSRSASPPIPTREPDCRELINQKRHRVESEPDKNVGSTHRLSLDRHGNPRKILYRDNSPKKVKSPQRFQSRPAQAERRPVFDRLDREKPRVFNRLDGASSRVR